MIARLQVMINREITRDARMAFEIRTIEPDYEDEPVSIRVTAFNQKLVYAALDLLGPLQKALEMTRGAIRRPVSDDLHDSLAEVRESVLNGTAMPDLRGWSMTCRHGMILVYDRLMEAKRKVLIGLAAGEVWQIDPEVEAMAWELFVSGIKIKTEPKEKEPRWDECFLMNEVLAKWMYKGSRMPYDMWKWYIDKKVPGTPAIREATKDFMFKLDGLRLKEQEARDQDVAGDWYWERMQADRDELMHNWRNTISLLAFGREEKAPPGLGKVWRYDWSGGSWRQMTQTEVLQNKP